MLHRSRTSSAVDLSQAGKITKPPVFPTFSGEEPTLKDECGIETFLFQIKGARKDVTDQAVRSALLTSLRGGASGFVEYIGLDSPLDHIVEQLAERYMTAAAADTLVCQFHQLVQEKNEPIRDFAGQIEKIFKKLQLQIPEWYPDETLLKDRLFYGMHQHMKDSLRYLYTHSETTYTDLLKAAYAAKVESAKDRALRSKAAISRQEESSSSQKKEGNNSKQVNEMVTKIEELTTIVKAAQYGGNKKGAQRNQKGSQSAPTTPIKSKSAGKANQEGEKFGRRPPQCWHCGGWGHIIRECPSTSNVKWQELSDAVDGKPQHGKAQDPANKK